MYLFSLQVLSIACALACLLVPAWSRPARKCDDKQRNFNTISTIYNLTVYPNQLPVFEIGAAGVPSGLFNQNVVGRVDPVGDFVGFQDSIEYFFALAPLPQGNAASAAITSYKITEFTSACLDVAASVVYLFCSVVNPGSPDNGTPLATLKQVSERAASATTARHDLYQLSNPCRWRFGSSTMREQSSNMTPGSRISTTGSRLLRVPHYLMRSTRRKASKRSVLPLSRDAPGQTHSGRA